MAITGAGNSIDISNLVARGRDNGALLGDPSQAKITTLLPGDQSSQLSPAAKQLTVEDLNTIANAFEGSKPVSAGGCGGCCCCGGGCSGGNG